MGTCYRTFPALSQRAAPASVDAMSSVAARSFGVSASVMRPTSPYLKTPPLAHSTTSPMACFLVVATRRAAVRNSLRSWLNPELPLPLLGAGEEGVPLAGGLAIPFPPETLVPFPGGGVSLGEFDGALPGVGSVGECGLGGFGRRRAIRRRWIKLSRNLRRLLLFVLNHLQDLAI